MECDPFTTEADIRRHKLVADLIAATRYVLDSDEAGWPGHSPIARLRFALDALDAHDAGS